MGLQWPISYLGILSSTLGKFSTILSWLPPNIVTFVSSWNTTFGTPPATHSTSAPQKLPPKHAVSGVQEIPSLSEIQSLPNVNLPPGSQPMASQQYSGAPIPSFVSPSMWQESVASVYEGGKRQWTNDYDDGNMNPMSKRPR